MFRLRNAIIAWLVSIAGFIALGILLLLELNFIGLGIVVVLSILILPRFWGISRIAASAEWEGNVDSSPTVQEWIQIPTEKGSFLWGKVYRDRNNPHSAKPYIIVAHGAGGSASSMDVVSVPLALNGFHVLTFSQSGHGSGDHVSPGNKHNYVEMMLGVHDAVRFILQQSDLIAQGTSTMPRIGFIGLSSGGIMALTQAYLNSNIKVTIAMSGVHDFMELRHRHFSFFNPSHIFFLALQYDGMILDYNDEENKLISPKYCLRPDDPTNQTRVFMIHAKNDLLPFDQALANKALANIPDEHCLFPGWGGHNIRCQETVAMGQVIRWFNQFL